MEKRCTFINTLYTVTSVHESAGECCDQRKTTLVCILCVACSKITWIASITFITNRISSNVLEHVGVSISMLEHATQNKPIILERNSLLYDSSRPDCTITAAARGLCGFRRNRSSKAGPATQFTITGQHDNSSRLRSIAHVSSNYVVLSPNGGRDTNTNSREAYKGKTRVWRFGPLVTLHFYTKW